MEISLLIKKINTAVSGDIIVALIDQNEVTLKKFRSFKKFHRTGTSQTKNYKTRIFGEDRVKVQGKTGWIKLEKF